MFYVYTAFDHGEDGRHLREIASFLFESGAKSAAKGRGAMGCGDGSVEKRTVYDDIEDFNANSPEGLRKKALAKLTPAEKDALGVE